MVVKFVVLPSTWLVHELPESWNVLVPHAPAQLKRGREARKAGTDDHNAFTTCHDSSSFPNYSYTSF
jgi:hypothetical protein